MKPYCTDCNGEIEQLTLTNRQYNNGVWYTLNEDDIVVWYRCKECLAEYNENEVKELIVK